MIYVKYPSALEFWLAGPGWSNTDIPYKKLDFSPAEAQGRCPAGLNLSAPVTVMVATCNMRRNNASCKCMAAPSHFPSNAFVQVAENICVESPEMCFLEAAGVLPLPYLVELGNCLCAGYYIDANARYRQKNRASVTNVAKIESFVRTAVGCYGVKNAHRAVRFIHDGSGSPMESKLGVALFLPISEGGYALKPGVMNMQVRLSGKAAAFLNLAECRVDIGWKPEKTAFEYDSELTHSNDRQRQYDAKRRLALEQSGYKVITFTNDSVSTFSNIEKSVMMLHGALKMKKRTYEMEKFRSRRVQLFYDLFRTDHPFF